MNFAKTNRNEKFRQRTFWQEELETNHKKRAGRNTGSDFIESKRLSQAVTISF
ncbi:hypothetical protein LEP1GSC172_0087 [Leptospira noguchii]|uniref:Uncharacterized protein n=1 Tax=Leptospira noguchii TaxID=28182 RepID=M6V490_9LEPT|nr:hypothetical protein LEP1GSC172_0087 [Leptospira noguchii]